ncbi:hypothetical protein EV363DRAFT_1356647 [Boletus edulis]|nr:hypothetical protein EV363DRAFT_1356647 [Boletus edulis]
MSLPKPNLIRSPGNLAQSATKRFLSVPQCLKPSRPTEFRTTSMHRCLLISEVYCLVLEFIRQYDELPEDGECKEGHKLGTRTLASLARTCRAFSSPALDLLWMRLDSLDPLIKLLPTRIWAKKHSRFVIRMFLGDKHELTFRQYAVRVQYLHGPCRGILPSVQRNVFTALARLPGVSLPLLPNLTELVWNESDSRSVVDPTVSLLKYFAGPRVTTVSLFLMTWPIYASTRTVLADLPNLCPNVTSFTAVPRAIFNDYSQDVGEVVNKWPSLRVLRSCQLSQAIMDELASRAILNALSIELNSFITDPRYTFSLEGSDTLCCLRYLQTLQGTPSHLRLRVDLDLALPPDMDALFRMLPTRFDTTWLRSLMISSKPSYRCVRTLRSFSLTEPLLASLYPFSMLVTLDLNAFSTSKLDDVAYERMAATWPGLRSLKLGTADGAVIAMLRSCPYLETLHIVLDGSIPPPPPMVMPDVDRDTQHGELAGSDEEGTERTTMSQGCTWGISNQCITQIHVGHSPVVRHMERLNDLVLCLRSVLPRLRRIQSKKEAVEMSDIFDMAESEGWLTVQRLLVEKDMTCI